MLPLDHCNLYYCVANETVAHKVGKNKLHIWLKRAVLASSWLTFASSFVRKSAKPKPRWVPVPLSFLGTRNDFSSPKTLHVRHTDQCIDIKFYTWTQICSRLRSVISLRLCTLSVNTRQSFYSHYTGRRVSRHLRLRTGRFRWTSFTGRMSNSAFGFVQLHSFFNWFYMFYFNYM